MKQNKEWSEEQERLLAQLLQVEGVETEDAQRITRRRDPKDSPLSFTQQRLWLLDQLSPDNPAYNVPLAVRFSGSLDLSVLARVLREVVRRHEALRTTFPASGGRPWQLIAAPSEEFQLPVTDLSALEAPRREAEALRLASQEALCTFDLARGPLLRARMLRLSEAEHILLLSMHHIVSDGWSVGVLFRELCQLYEAFLAGEASPLPKLPVQYADYAVWQREHFAGGDFAEQLHYWRERLSGAPPVLELPTDRPRPAQQNWRGSSQIFSLGGPLTSALKEVSRERGSTPFMLLLAALNLLLYRYTGRADLLVGTPIAGRTRSEVEGLIGCFINTLALRTQLDAAESFEGLLARVREVCLGAYAHQEMPFEKLVEELQPERSLSHAPLFQVMFTLQNVPGGMVRLPGLRLSTFALAQQTTKFDLSLVMFEERPGELTGILLYNADLFEPETVRRMSGHYTRLLEGIAADPRRRVCELPLMCEDERRTALVEWNRTEAERPSPTYVHEMFERQARRTPEAVAVETEQEQLSYAELNRRADALTRRLRQKGVEAGSHVGVYLERSPEMVVAVLAVLKAGGAYVPLDPAYPPQRLSYMIEDARVKVLVTQRHLAEGLPEHDTELLLADEPNAPDDAPHDDLPRANISDEQPAYVIYTSGSTGLPKGVSVPHRAVCNHLLWRQSVYPLTADDAFLQKASLGFDISAWEIFSPLIAGARLVLARAGGQGDCGYLVRLIREKRITTAHFGPALLRVFLDEAGIEGLDSLGRVFCGGEALTRDLQEKFFSRLRAELHHQYGPTEATIDVTAWKCERAGDPRHVPIGRPISNVQTYVLDARLEAVPTGAAGELYVGGKCLAHGYVNRPGLTAERFVPDPFSAWPGARLYKTGDKVRHLPDGSLQYLGRLDRQVKLRGFRIELGEVESVLATHAGVREAVAVLREDEGGDMRLVAYFVAAQGPEPGDGELRAYLAERLPDYMVPSAFVRLERLPLNVNGKVDRAALPEPGRPPRSERYVAPRNELERTLADIWAELLRVERVGVDESFFELGGHSLLATQVISRVSESLQVEVPLRTLFESPTVGGLAEAIARQAGQQPARPAPINPGARSLEEQTLAVVELMSEEDVDAILERMLSEKEGDA